MGWGAAQALLWGMDIPAMYHGLMLDPVGLNNSEWWRFATYSLVHANLLHFLVTAAVIYFSGREVEPIIGRRHVLGMCLVGNLAGGVVSLALQPPPDELLGIAGSSAAAMAVLAAYATVLPEIEHRFRFLGIVPLRFHTRHAVLLVLALCACAVKWNVAGEIGPAGLIVGAAVGWLWARALGFGRLFWWQRAAGEREALERRHDRMSPDEFITLEVDPILEKICHEGIRSLTRAERRILERAKEKIEERG